MQRRFADDARNLGDAQSVYDALLHARIVVEYEARFRVDLHRVVAGAQGPLPRPLPARKGDPHVGRNFLWMRQLFDASQLTTQCAHRRALTSHAPTAEPLVL